MTTLWGGGLILLDRYLGAHNVEVDLEFLGEIISSSCKSVPKVMGKFSGNLTSV